MLAVKAVCTPGGGGGGGGGEQIYTLLWVTGRLICTTALSFSVKLLVLQFSHSHMCMVQQETWMDLHHPCVADTLVVVPCCRLIFMTYIFRHCDFLSLNIISILAHRNIERECVRTCVWQTDYLVYIHNWERKNTLHLYRIIVFVVLLSLYWVVQWSCFAWVNAFCNLSCKKSWGVAA